MEIQYQLEKMKKLHSNLLDFIDNEINLEESFETLINIIEEQNIPKNLSDLKLFLHMIVNISNNHHRGTNFFSKIEKILRKIKNEIQHFFTNSEIFKIFKSNKRILLFLITEKILNIDASIYDKFNKFRYKLLKYHQYFLPEINQFKKERSEPIENLNNEEFEKFNEKRSKGENDNYICELIRNDSIEEFIIYVNREQYPLKSSIKPSIFETNSFLLNRIPNLIEYASFFGSVQIFRYLFQNNAEIKNKLQLWSYAVHSDNAEIISLLEENLLTNNDKFSFNEIVLEAIKCHNNDVANYILDKYCSEKVKRSENQKFRCDFDDIFSMYSYCYHNYTFIPEKITDNCIFYACKYDYLSLVKLFILYYKVAINKIKILNINIFHVI